MSEEQQNTPIAGLNTDANPEAQPKGTYRYALNAVQGQHEGDGLLIGNESSNAFYAELPKGFTPIGHVYIGDGETCIFSVNSDEHENVDYSSTVGQIGVFSKKSKYIPLVENKDFNFKLSHPIRAIYRLRRNGEKYVYFTDNLNPVRFANVSNIKNHFFPNNGGVNIKSFSLLVDSDSFLSLDCTKVEDRGGQLTPGMYQVAVQIMASDGTAGQITSISSPLLIYSNSIEKPHGNGSIHSGKLRDWENEETTYKSIYASVDVGVWQDYHTERKNNRNNSILYRFLLLGYNTGTGECNEIFASDTYDFANKKDFLFTGNNLKRKLSPQDIVVDPIHLSTAKYLTQIDNRLILGNTTEFSNDLFILQKYASQVCADAYLDKVNYDNRMRAPWSCYSKEEAGYMPGEVYAFGIRYLLSDGSYTPVFHIPGKNPNPLYKNTIFDQVDNNGYDPPFCLPMDNEGNESTEIYTTNALCQFDYWGVDHAGESLKNKPVRFHRFPQRPKSRDNGLTAYRTYAHFQEEEDKSYPVDLKEEKTIHCYVVVRKIFQKNSKKREGNWHYFHRQLEYQGEFYVIGDNRHSNGLHYIVPQLFKLTDLEDFSFYGKELNIKGPDGEDWEYGVYTKLYDKFVFDNDLNNVHLTINGLNGVGNAEKEGSLAKDVGENFSNSIMLPVATFYNGYETGYIGCKISFLFYKTTQYKPIYRKNIWTQPFGIHFSNIKFPEPAELNGLSVMGYQILRLPRLDEDKTVLDSCVISSIYPSAKENYTSNGLFTGKTQWHFITPDYKSNLPYAHIDRMVSYATGGGIDLGDHVEQYLKTPEERLCNAISPSYLFKQDAIKLPDSVKLTMPISIHEINYDQFNIKDVVDGTSFKAGLSAGDPDNDGVQLSVLIRKWDLWYKNRWYKDNKEGIKTAPIERIFKLKSLESSYLQKMKKTLVNISSDNPAYFVQLGQNLDRNSLWEPLVYGYLTSSQKGFYTDYLSRGYIPVTWSFQQKDSVTCFGGDTYISPMRYVSTVFYDTITAYRKEKKVERAWWKELIGYVASGLLIIGGAITAAFTAGTSLAVAIGAVAAGVTMGALTVKQTVAYYENKLMADKMEALYTNKWANGLRDCVHDIVTSLAFRVGIKRDAVESGTGTNILSDIYCDHGQIDDLVAWTGHVLNKLWFESTINLSLRCKLLNTDIGFLDTLEELPNNGEKFAIQDVDRITRYLFYPMERDNILHRYLQEKLTILNNTRKNTRGYLGTAVGEWYRVNPDYQTENYIKKYYTLPKEYNFCAEKNELFPRRVYYSNQSFQEDLMDHYRVILENNYKDIEGSLGEITNLFTIQNNLYVHTSDGLWHLPQQYKERTAGDLVTVIGTGEYFSQPPVKMVDVHQMGAGCRHSFSLVKTKHGVFFVSENDRKIYQFDGKQINPISDLGLSKWFEENIPMKRSPYNRELKIYEDNPYVYYGSGFMGVYDSENERIIFTKKELLGENFEGFGEKYFYFCGRKGYVIPNFFGKLRSLGADEKGMVERVNEDCQLEITYRKAIIEYKREKRTRIIEEKKHNYPGMIIYPAGDWDYPLGSYVKDPLMDLTRRINEYNCLNAYPRNDFPDPIGMSLQRLRKVQDEGLLGNYRSYPFTNRIITIDEMRKWWSPRKGYDKRDLAMIYLFKPHIKTDSSGLINGYLKYENGATNSYSMEFVQLVSKALVPDTSLYYSMGYVCLYANQTFKNDEEKQTFLRSLGIQVRLMLVEDDMEADIHKKIKEFFPEEKDFKFYKQGFNDGLLGLNYAFMKNKKIKFDHIDVLRLEDFFNEGFPIKDFELFLEGTRKEYTETHEEEYEVDVPYVIRYEEGKKITFDGIPWEKGGMYNDEHWTISYSLKTGSWVSWHSYHPTFMFKCDGGFITAQNSEGKFYLHKNGWDFGIFYGKLSPFIIELVHLSDGSVNLWEDLSFKTVAKKYESSLNFAKELPRVTFEKALFYNANQTTELVELRVKDQLNNDSNLLMDEIKEADYNAVYLNKDEKIWHVNMLRNIWQTDSGMFDQTLFLHIKENIDKKLTHHTLDLKEEWCNLEPLRDLYMISRFIFENHFVQLSVQLSEPGTEESER